MNKITTNARHAGRTAGGARFYSPRRSIIGAAAAILIAPALLSAAAANAATPFSVTSPTSTGIVQNSATLPALVSFTGAGLPANDTIDVQYTNGTGAQQTAIYGGNTSDSGGNWSATANFGDLAKGAVTVVSVVTAHLPSGAADTSVTPVDLTFTLAYAPNPANPFTLTSPSPLEVVTTPTPLFTGTGEPGSTITVKYGARSGATATAGTALVAADGTYSVATDFSSLEPGSLGSGADVYETDATGSPIIGAGPLGRGFSFATAPVSLTQLSLTTTPSSATVAAATTAGFGIAASGFSPSEQVVVSVTGPSGAPIALSGSRPAELFANSTDGSYSDTLVLPASATAGTYTITVTGVRTGRTANGTLAVTGSGTTTGIHLPVVSG